MKHFAIENKYFGQGARAVIGCDEVGRGSLAGPVVAAAVSFKKPARIPSWWKFVNDSKTLKASDREELSEYIKDSAVWGIGVVGHEQIDRVNIHHASLRAMHMAVRKVVKELSESNVQVLVDGKFLIPKLHLPQQALVGGDGRVHSIAAASIIAKVYRDKLMAKLGRDHPQYLFAKHKGYATLAHRQAIAQHGLSAVHRATFCDNIVSTNIVRKIAS